MEKILEKLEEVTRTYQDFQDHHDELLQLFRIRPSKEIIITNLDKKSLTLKATDKKNNIDYTSQYLRQANSLRHSNYSYKIKVTIVSKNKVTEELYLSSKKTPIITILTIEDGIYEIQVKYNSNEAKSLKTRLIKKEPTKKNEKNLLLTKRNRSTINISRNKKESYESTVVYQDNKPVQSNNQFEIRKTDNIIYNINKYSSKENCNFFTGICIKEAKKIDETVFARQYNLADDINLDDPDITSVLIFKGTTKADDTSHTLEIYKKKRFYINYSKKRTIDEAITTNNPDIKFTIETLNSFAISTEELLLIAKIIESDFDNSFIHNVAAALAIFSKRIENQKLNFNHTLTTALLSLKGPHEIETIITNNKEAFFNSLINEYYLLITNGQNKVNTQEPKVLKKTNL